MQDTPLTSRAGVLASDRPRGPSPYILSYRELRTSIGIIGIALPVVLATGKWLLESQGLLDSISAYYYSVMRGVFVGSLWAIAVFLFSYRYARADNIASKIVSICALGVSLFPAAPANPTDQQQAIGIAHTVFAAGFFLTLAYFALFLFRKTYPDQQPTRQKQTRNRVYLICGLAMVFCLALIVLLGFLPDPEWLLQLHPFFILEALSVEAFGIAWFIKGGAILKDKA
ncbi:MAG TPA: hypothetical protein VH540_28140 [Ktedonobacterales bacterium]|jgi:hypothetical protein